MKRVKTATKAVGLPLLSLVVICSLLAGSAPPVLAGEAITTDQIKTTLQLGDLHVDNDTLEGLLSYPLPDYESKSLRDLAEVVTGEKRYADSLHNRQLAEALKLVEVMHGITNFIDTSSKLTQIVAALAGIHLTWFGMVSGMLSYGIAATSIIRAFKKIRCNEMIYGSIATVGYIPLRRDLGYTDAEAWADVVNYYHPERWLDAGTIDALHTLATHTFDVECTDYLDDLDESIDAVANLIRERVAIYESYSNGQYTEGIATSPTQVLVTNDGPYAIHQVVLINERTLWFDERSEPYPAIYREATISFPFGADRIDHIEFTVMNVRLRIPFEAEVPTTRILFDDTHDTDNDELIGPGANYRMLKTVLEGEGYVVDELDTGPVAYESLRGYDVFILPDVELELSIAEVEAMVQYLNNAGGILIIGEWKGAHLPDSVSKLSEVAGIKFDDTIVFDPDDYYQTLSWPIIHTIDTDHGIGNGVSEFAMYAGSSLIVSGSAVPIAWGDSNTYVEDPAGDGQAPDGDITAARPMAVTLQSLPQGEEIVTLASSKFAVASGEARLVCIGDSDLWKTEGSDWSGYDPIENYSNKQLLINVVNWLAARVSPPSTPSPGVGIVKEVGEVATKVINVGLTIGELIVSLDWPGSDLHLGLVDPLGRHLGYNPDTGEVENEIPGAEYSGHGAKPEWGRIHEPEPGDWTATVYAHDIDGEYELYSLEVNPIPRETIKATIDSDPDSLSPAGESRWITVYIELPGGPSVCDIDVGTVMLNGLVPAEDDPTYGFVSDIEGRVGDHDQDGVLDCMVKFDRLRALATVEPGENIELAVTGQVAGFPFEGTDTVRVLSGGNPHSMLIPM